MIGSFNYRDNQLWAEEIPVAEIAKQVGTPFYLYSHAALTQQWQAFATGLAQQPHLICYAVKANGNLAVLNTLARLGSGFDIVSGGELARVIAAGGSPQKVVFSGVGKTADEMASALKQNIFCFNVESESELNTIHQIAAHENVKAPIALRVNPHIDAGTHPYIATGLKESKFGIDIDLATTLYHHANAMPHLQIKGIACHIGSQLTTLTPFVDALKRLLTVVANLTSQGITLSHIDVGGGLGVSYQHETPPTPAEYTRELLKYCSDPQLTLVLEPGRAIVANAGLLVSKVLTIKKSDHKHFCVIDCAMNDFIRPTLYSAWQDIIPLTRHAERSPVVYDVVGPVCESGDFLGKDRSLQVQEGDYLAILGAGGYGFVMSSNYNTRPRAPEVMVKGREFKVVRKRETIAALFADETIW